MPGPMTHEQNDYARRMVRFLRNERGMTQVEIAKAVETGQGNISKLMSGKEGTSEGVLRRLAQLANRPPEEILQVMGYAGASEPARNPYTWTPPLGVPTHAVQAIKAGVALTEHEDHELSHSIANLLAGDYYDGAANATLDEILIDFRSIFRKALERKREGKDPLVEFLPSKEEREVIARADSIARPRAAKRG